MPRLKSILRREIVTAVTLSAAANSNIIKHQKLNGSSNNCHETTKSCKPSVGERDVTEILVASSVMDTTQRRLVAQLASSGTTPAWRWDPVW